MRYLLSRDTRLLLALQEIAKKGTYESEHYSLEPDCKKAKRLLVDIASGKMVVSVEPIDITQIVAKVNWACNGGII